MKKGTVQGWHIQNNRRRCAALRATHDVAGKVDVDMDVPGERERERADYHVSLAQRVTFRKSVILATPAIP